MLVMGIDPSLSSTGIIVFGTEHQFIYCRVALQFPKARGWRRLMLIERAVADLLLLHKPDIVVIEGYGSLQQGLLEVGSLIRRQVFLANITFYEVPPTTLKKWASGSGKSDKLQMSVAILEKWGFSSPISDIVDAYALARMGEFGEGPLLSIKGVKCHSSALNAAHTQGV